MRPCAFVPLLVCAHACSCACALTRAGPCAVCHMKCDRRHVLYVSACTRCACTHAKAGARMHGHTHTHGCMHEQAHARARMCTRTHAFMRACVHVGVHVCVCVGAPVHPTFCSSVYRFVTIMFGLRSRTKPMVPSRSSRCPIRSARHLRHASARHGTTPHRATLHHTAIHRTALHAQSHARTHARMQNQAGRAAESQLCLLRGFYADRDAS